jgi:uncharacterized membrane protein
MMNSLISGDQVFLLWGVVLSMVAFAMWSEETKWGRKISGTIIIIILGLLLSNIGIIPSSSPVYSHVWATLVPLAIPLLLIKADLRHIVKESGSVLVAFIFGAVGSVLGAMVAFYFIPLPELHAQLTSILTASYIGGSMNFADVTSALGVTGEPIIVPTLAADNLVGISYLVVLAWLPASLVFQKIYSHNNKQDQTKQTKSVSLWGEFHMKDAVAAIAVSYFIVLFARYVEDVVNIQGAAIITITIVSVTIASIFGAQLKKLKGVFQLGMMIMYMFFGTIGASANIWILFETAPILILFTTTIVIGHFIVIFTMGRLFNFSLPEIITASNACALGPTTAAGLAASKGWDELITPGILVGVFGYAIANFVGLAIWGFLG